MAECILVSMPIAIIACCIHMHINRKINPIVEVPGSENQIININNPIIKKLK